MTDKKYTLGIDIGSTTVKIAILDEENQLLFADYERHFANIQETLAYLLGEAHEKLGELTRRTCACQPPGHPVHAGSHCSFHFIKSTRSADRRCHRARR